MQLLPVNPAAKGNTAFSEALPGMQLALDSTSINSFKTCPRRYYYEILRGLQTRSGNVHLQFGIYIHQARELYDHLSVDHPDWSHDAKLDAVLDWALNTTWNAELGRPWVSGHTEKNRQTFIQTIVWYLDIFGQNDPFQTLLLANGRPAVEVSFRFDSGLRTGAGEVVQFCGHIDRLASMNDVGYIKDIKTSTYAPDSKWAAKFTPGVQFSMYPFAVRMGLPLLGGVHVKDLIVDGVQVGVTFSRFQSHLIPRTDDQLDEWFDGIADTAEQMEDCAAKGEWPMRETSCDMYGGCPFRVLCARSPRNREDWVKTDFEVRQDGGWNPLRVRGDV